ncbi:MAG: DUF4340 domain-containing protein [Chloroflexi bacterium]|nr:DUF4340 domain-containing protein [Chloroflexota bacterium]
MGRSTLGMVLVFGVLAAVVWMVQTNRPAPVEGASTYVLQVDEGAVSRIDVTTSAGTAGFTRVEPIGWNFAESGQTADFSRVSSVVNRIAKLRAQAKVQDQVPNRAEFKLDPPLVTAQLTMKDGTTHKVLFGAQTVTSAAYYALAEENGILYTVSTLIVTDSQGLITNPPIPTPTPGTPSPVASPSATPSAIVTPPATTPTTTPGLPAPSIS